MVKQTNDESIASSILDSHPSINCAMRREWTHYTIVFVRDVKLSKLPGRSRVTKTTPDFKEVEQELY